MPSFNDMWGNLDDGFPNDWIPADPGIDDWVRPGEWYTQPPPAVPSSPQQAFGRQPDSSAPQTGTVPNSGPWNDPASNAGVAQPPPKPDPFAAYFSMIPASSLIPLAGAPPILPGSAWQPPQPPPFELPLHLANGGILGGIGQRLAEQKAAANDPWAAARNTIVGGFADPPLAADGLPVDFGQGGIVGSLRNLGPSNSSSRSNYGFNRPFLPPNEGDYQGLDPNSLVRPVADTWEEQEHQRQREQRQFDMFDGRAFGTSPHFGSLAPRQIPPAARTNSPQSAPRAQAPQAPSPSQRVAPAVRSVPPEPVASPTPPSSPRSAPAGVRSGPAAQVNSLGAAEETLDVVAPPGKLGTPIPSGPRWLPSTEGIKKALTEGSGLQEAIRAALPEYDGKTTFGVLITNEGDVVPLRSPGASPLYNNYSPAGHVEGKAAIWIRQNNSTGGVVYHNNTDGTCGFCNSMLTTLLPYKSLLRVVPPRSAVAKDAWAIDYPKAYEGNSAIPKPPRLKLPPQQDLFGSPP